MVSKGFSQKELQREEGGHRRPSTPHPNLRDALPWGRTSVALPAARTDAEPDGPGGPCVAGGCEYE